MLLDAREPSYTGIAGSGNGSSKHCYNKRVCPSRTIYLAFFDQQFACTQIEFAAPLLSLELKMEFLGLVPLAIDVSV
jgi:hypothetical protein